MVRIRAEHVSTSRSISDSCAAPDSRGRAGSAVVSWRGRAPARFALVWLVPILVAVLPSGRAHAQERALPLWRAAADSSAVSATSRRAVRGRLAVVFDRARLANPRITRHSLLLPDGTSLVATQVRVEHPAPGVVTWLGRVLGDSLSSVIISSVRGTPFGSIHTSDGRIFRLLRDSTGKTFIEDVDPAGVPDEKDPHSTPADSSGTGGTGCGTDDPGRVDVLVAYTPDARVGAGGKDAMEALVYCAVGQANLSYLDSGIDVRLNLVYVGEEPYTEKGDVAPALTAVTSPSDGELDNVHVLRNRFGADVVALIIETDNNVCGYSHIMPGIEPAFESQAFSVVLRDCATAAFSFAHELGHLFSANHDWGDEIKSGPFATNSYNHGYLKIDGTASPKTAWRTLMGVKTACRAGAVLDDDCVRLLRWSDPASNWNGEPMGVGSGPKQSDNVRTLNEAAPTVANFRCSSPSRQDAWMKDAWADTGAEPEPALAGAPMWKSPYIWVRNTSDTNRLHAHEHQNPIAGAPNYVYVKLHNGTSGATGNLELYVANASTGLAWPTDWTRIATTTIGALAAGETRIVESTWTPTVRGHFCLVARWSSPSDLMTVPEGWAIEANVRANNNLVWRNVNIIDLTGGSLGISVFAIGNDRPSPQIFTLRLAPSRAQFDARFVTKGIIGLRFVDPVFNIGKARRLRSLRMRGFVARGDTLVLIDPKGGTIEGIRLAGRARIPVELVVRRVTPAADRGERFMFDVVQTATSPRRRLVGGVSYEIRTRSR